jgi:hypothetical protein
MDKVSRSSSNWGLNIPNWGFNIYVPWSSRPERFEWRHSSGPEVGALEGGTRGLELVRVGTGKVVAAFAWTALSAKKLGKFRWCTDDWFGEEGDLLVLISLLAVLEYIRKQQIILT